MEFYHFIVNFFHDGGFFLYLLLIIFVVGVAIAFERTFFLTKETLLNRNLWAEVTPLIGAGNFKQVVAITSKSNAAIATVLNYVRPPLRTLLSTYGSANNHVFNSVLAQFSVGIFGSEQPWVVRLPSILFGIASVWAFHFVARQLWTGQVALIGTFMFAVSYHLRAT